MADLGDIHVGLTADSADFKTSMKDAVASMGSLGAAAIALNQAMEAVGKVWDTVSETFHKAIEAFAESEASQVRLATAFRATGQSVDISSITAFADQLQELTGIDDDATVSAAALLANFSLTKEQITQLLPGIADLSSAMGVDMQGAAIAVGRAVESGSGALRGLKMAMNAAEKAAYDNASSGERVNMIMNQLKTSVGGTAEAIGGTLAGSIKKADAAWGDFYKALGATLAPISKAFDAVSAKVANFATLLVSASNFSMAGAVMGMFGGDKTSAAGEPVLTPQVDPSDFYDFINDVSNKSDLLTIHAQIAPLDFTEIKDSLDDILQDAFKTLDFSKVGKGETESQNSFEAQIGNNKIDALNDKVNQSAQVTPPPGGYRQASVTDLTMDQLKDIALQGEGTSDPKSILIGAVKKMAPHFSGLVQAFAEGGLPAAVAKLAVSTPAFMGMMRHLEAIFDHLVTALNPLVALLEPLVAGIANVLGSIVDVLGVVIKAFVNAIINVVGFFSDDAADFLRRYQSPEKAPKDRNAASSQAVGPSSYEETGYMSAFAYHLAQANEGLEKMTHSMTNVPTGFKIAAARYAATDVSASGKNVRDNSGANGGSIVTVKEMRVMANDPLAFVKAVDRLSARGRFNATGSPTGSTVGAGTVYAGGASSAVGNNGMSANGDQY